MNALEFLHASKHVLMTTFLRSYIVRMCAEAVLDSMPRNGSACLNAGSNVSDPNFSSFVPSLARLQGGLSHLSSLDFEDVSGRLRLVRMLSDIINFIFKKNYII